MKMFLQYMKHEDVFYSIYFIYYLKMNLNWNCISLRSPGNNGSNDTNIFELGPVFWDIDKNARKRVEKCITVSDFGIFHLQPNPSRN